MERKKKIVKSMPTIETIWKKEFITEKQYKQIERHLNSLKSLDPENPEQVEKYVDKSIKIIKGLLERAVLFDVYKDLTSDLYASPNIRLVPEAMRKLFIFLGPEGKNIEDEQDKQWRAWRE